MRHPIAITAATLFWCSAASAQVELSVEVPRKNIRVFEPFVVNYTISNIGSDEASGMRLQEGYPRSPFSDCASSWAKVFKEQS